MKNRCIGQAKKLNFFRIILFVFVFANTLVAFANPGVTTYQAKIIKPDGLPLESSSVNFKFTILDPAGSCILYSETYSSVNMASTAGLISFSLGSGVKTYPASATTFADVFSNITPTLSCDAGGPGTYSPGANDVRKIVMQFHDGTGWQTLPAMNINAVPYAMYATEAQKISGLPSCAAGQALGYNGVSFSCETVGGGVTSSTVIAALGYEPVQPASFTTVNSTVSSVSSTVSSLASNLNSVSSTVNTLSGNVFSVSSTVTGLTNTVSTLSASMAALTSSQWISSGTAISYSTGNVGIGTSNAASRLTVSGSTYLSGPIVTGNTPPTGGALDMGPLFGSMTYSSPFFQQDTLTDLSAQITAGRIVATKFNADSNNGSIASGRFSYTQNEPGNLNTYNSLIGDYVVTDNNGSANIGEVGSLFTLSVHNGSSTATSMYGINSRAYTYSGNVGNSYGGYFSSNAPGGSITNNFGVMIDASTAVAQSNYGLYIANTGSAAASQTYNIYSAGVNSNNHFAGYVGIGVTLPSARLHLPAGTAAIAALKLTSSTLLTTPASGAIEYDGVSLYYTDGTNTRKTLATGVGVTSSTITSALGYTPANSATVSTLQNTVASMAASQWTASGSAINFTSGNVGIGTSNPTQTLHVSGSIRANTIYAADGAFNTPAITFANATGTGFFNSGGYLGFSVGGGLKGIMTNSYLDFSGGGAGPKINFTSGSEATPSYAFNIDSDTGMYNPNAGGGSNELGFSTAGVERLRIASAGAVGIGTSAPVTTLHVVSKQSAAAVHPDRAGFVLEAEGTSVGGRIAAKVYSDTENPLFVAYRARGTKANPQPLLSGDLITAISPVGFDGSNWQTGAHVRFHTTENWNGSAIGSAISFRTVTNGTSTTLDRMRIDHNGNVGIGTSTPSAKLDVNDGAGRKVAFSPAGISGDFANLPLIHLENTNNVADDWFLVNAADKFHLTTEAASGTEKLTVTSSGNVGIGTSNPTQLLQVGGGTGNAVAEVRGNNSGYAAGLRVWNANAAVGAYSYLDFGWGVSAAVAAVHARPQSDNSTNLVLQASDITGTRFDAVTMNGNGNVGIGIVGLASATLDVAGTTNSAENLRLRGKTSIEGGQLSLMDGTGTGGWEIDNYGASGTERLRFFRDKGENNLVEPMVISPSGNVGIGTTGPADKLQVAGGIIVGAQSGSTDDNDDYVIKSNGQLHLQANQSGSSNTSYVHLVLEAGTAGSSNSAVIMQTRGSERMRVDPNGYVGIGTTSPVRALQVGQTGAWSDTSGILVKGANPGLELTDTQATPQRWLIANGVVAANDGKLGLAYDVNNSRHNIVVTNTGRVGIGTMSDTLAGKPNKLNIVSSNAAGYALGLSVPNTTDSNQIIFVNPNGEVGSVNTNGTATTFNTASDRRLKGNIRDLEEEKIDNIFNRLQPRQWEWKYAEGQPHGEGFIAQELAEVIPDAVTKGDVNPNLKPNEEGFKLWKVDYSKLTPYLTAAIKNIRKKIEALFITTETHTREIASTQEKVQKLETENANLKQENKAIKDYLCSKDPAAPICK
ncbi:MAG: tail fiber domain-containing protein [Pseudobdellovibrio sp.]|nr:tail fiber domain-containing protein [Pseudobdellovibrio sp.]